MILLAALLFSTGGAAVKLSSFNAWQVASLRSGIAALAIFLILPTARHGWNRRAVAVGVAYAGTMVSYVVANKLTTAANATFLQSTAPLYVLLLGPVLLKEPVRGRQLGFMAALATGLTMFFVGTQPTMTTAPDPVLGNLVGVACGLCWALTIIGLRGLGRNESEDRSGVAVAVALGNVLACAATAPVAVPIVATKPALDWGVVLFLGVFQIAIAYAFLTRGARSVGALEMSLLLLLEPVLAPVWAWIVHGEQTTTWGLAGGAFIVGATAAYAVSAERSAG